jgi:hypothetical protein
MQGAGADRVPDGACAGGVLAGCRQDASNLGTINAVGLANFVSFSKRHFDKRRVGEGDDNETCEHLGAGGPPGSSFL